jgi:hypothetical protein
MSPSKEIKAWAKAARSEIGRDVNEFGWSAVSGRSGIAQIEHNIDRAPLSQRDSEVVQEVIGEFCKRPMPFRIAVKWVKLQLRRFGLAEVARMSMLDLSDCRQALVQLIAHVQSRRVST